MESNSHHLVMGEMTDFLTGKTVPDTHDERYHQKLARLLVDTLGYDPKMIVQKREVMVRAGGREAGILVDFLVGRGEYPAMLIKYAPGSLVTRRLSNLALSRMIFPFQIPIVVTTNGEDAEIIDGFTGKVVGQGIGAIPGPGSPLMEERQPKIISAALFDKASRIAFACEVDGSCLMNDGFRCDAWYCYPDQTSEKE